MTLRRAFVLVALVCLPILGRADEPKVKRPLAIDDLYRLERIRTSALSPD